MAAMHRCVLLLTIAACAVAAVNGQSAATRQGQDTTGNQIEHYGQPTGYTFRSNVAGYLRLSTDVCAVKAAIGPDEEANYPAALAIYRGGNNSYKSDGTVRTFRELATTPYRGEPTWDFYARYFGTPGFMDEEIVAAFEGDAPYDSIAQRNETIVKGMESMIQTVYLLHEIDEAAGKIANRSISLATGAPHNIDETWAIWVGERPDCSLWGLAYRRGKEFGTLVDCYNSKVNVAMLEAHKAMHAAAEEGDAAAFAQQRQEVIRLFVIVGLQNALKYAELMDAARAKNEPDTVIAEQAEGNAYFRTIEPFVAQANNRSAATISSVFNPANPPPANALQTVKAAAEAVYRPLGITAADIGTFGSPVPAECETQATPANVAGGAAAAPAPAGGAGAAAAAAPSGGAVYSNSASTTVGSFVMMMLAAAVAVAAAMY